MDPRCDFYVYVIFRPDGSPCYVGKGRGRRWRTHLSASHNPLLRGIVDRSSGDIPIVTIRSGLTNDDAILIEASFIKAIGRFPYGPLVNMTDGGDGGSAGVKQSPERIENRVRHLRGKRRPAHVVEKVAFANRGKKRSEEVKAKLRGPKSDEHRLKLRLAKLGTKQSRESVELRIASLRGRPRPAEVREKVRASLIGKKHTDERHANLRAAWVRRKARANAQQGSFL